LDSVFGQGPKKQSRLSENVTTKCNLDFGNHEKRFSNHLFHLIQLGFDDSQREWLEKPKRLQSLCLWQSLNALKVVDC